MTGFPSLSIFFKGPDGSSPHDEEREETPHPQNLYVMLSCTLRGAPQV
jgi:hypothetical protein